MEMAMIRPVMATLIIVALLAWPVGAAASPPAVPLPSEPGFTATLRPLLEAKMKALRVPGAVVFVQVPGKGTWQATLGTANLDIDTPMRLDGHFRVGSITKTFTGTVILQLVDERKLGLDDPVAKYQPDAPNGANITIRDLLNMTSGLYNYSEDRGFNEQLDAEPGKVWDPKELLAIAFQHPPYFAPGKGFHYSNTNTVLLGLIIEQITGQPVANAFQARIFKPLGMTHTLLPKRNSAAIPDPHPEGYMFGTNVESLESTLLTGEQAAKADAAVSAPRDVTNVNPSWAWTAGAAISTLHDLQIWAKALATGTLLSPAMQQQRLRWIAAGSGPYAARYGLAIVDFNGFLGHDGQLPGFHSFMAYQPEKQATIVVLTNLYASPAGAEPSNELAKIIIEHIQ
jgi:D-alanyl-D-alanine carboxypeptidase